MFPMMHFAFPTQFCLCFVFSFLREDCNSQEKLKTLHLQNDLCKALLGKIKSKKWNRKKIQIEKIQTKRIKAQKEWAQMEHSDPCRAPTLGKYKDRCGYTKPFLQSSSRKNSLDWVRSRFWSLSCLRLHINKFPKGKKKVEFCFVVNIIVNIEDWNKL